MHVSSNKTDSSDEEEAIDAVPVEVPMSSKVTIRKALEKNEWLEQVSDGHEPGVEGHEWSCRICCEAGVVGNWGWTSVHRTQKKTCKQQNVNIAVSKHLQRNKKHQKAARWYSIVDVDVWLLYIMPIE